MSEDRKLGRGRLPLLWEDVEWFAVGGAAAAALVLGYVGFENQPDRPGEAVSRLDHAYHALQLWWLEYGSISEPTSWQLDVARLLAPAVLLYLAARAILALFREQLRLLWPTRRNRVVICGLGRQGWLLAAAFQDRGYRAVAIEQDEKNNWIKACRDRGIPVVVGDATDASRLRKARLHKAAYLIAVCGKDGSNANVAVHAREFLARQRDRRRGELTAFAHVVDLELCRLLRERVVLAEAGSQSSFRLRLFNVFEDGARKWLSEYPAFPENGERYGRPHLLVVGVGQLGRSLVVGAATEWLDRHAGAQEGPRITIVDREAVRRRDSLVLSHPELDELLVPVQTDVTWPEFEEARFLFDDQGRCDVTRIYVCLDDDVRGVAAALALLERVREHDVQIVVRTSEAAGLAGVLESDAPAGDHFELLQAFPLLERACVPDELLGETSPEAPARGREEYPPQAPEPQLASGEGRDRDATRR